MQLSDEQQQALIAFLQNSWPALAACPVCGNNDWSAPSRLYELVDYREPAPRSVPRTPGIPVVALTCESCAYVLLLDAVKTGVIKETDKG